MAVRGPAGTWSGRRTFIRSPGFGRPSRSRVRSRCSCRARPPPGRRPPLRRRPARRCAFPGRARRRWGPDPERPAATAPASRALALTRPKPGTRVARTGSATASHMQRVIRSQSPLNSPATIPAVFPHCWMPASSGMVSPSIVLARSVSTSIAGCATATIMSSGVGSCTISGGRPGKTSTKPPIREGAALSAWLAPEPLRSPIMAHSSSAIRSRLPPRSASAATAPATALAALPPSPEARGIPLPTSIAMPAVDPSRLITALDGQRGGVARGIRRDAAVVAGHRQGHDAGPGCGANHDFVAHALEREAEDVEAAPEVGSGRGGEGADRAGEAVPLRHVSAPSRRTANSHAHSAGAPAASGTASPPCRAAWPSPGAPCPPAPGSARADS